MIQKYSNTNTFVISSPSPTRESKPPPWISTLDTLITVFTLKLRFCLNIWSKKTFHLIPNFISALSNYSWARDFRSCWIMHQCPRNFWYTELFLEVESGYWISELWFCCTSSDLTFSILFTFEFYIEKSFLIPSYSKLEDIQLLINASLPSKLGKIVREFWCG